MCRFEFLSHLTHPQASYVQPHQHACCELVYYVQGSGQTCIGTQTSTYVSHSYSFITPGMVHDERHLETTEVLFIGFTTDTAISIDKNAIYHDDTQHSLLELLLRLKSEFTLQKQDYDKMLNLLTGELIIHLQRLWGQKSQPVLHYDHLVYTRNYMDEHYRQKFKSKPWLTWQDTATTGFAIFLKKGMELLRCSIYFAKGWHTPVTC